VHFEVSGIECSPLLPVLAGFAVSFISASAGLSGAFLLLPFQMSVLGFVSPAVAPTNLLYNVIAIPSGVWRFFREGRIAWPLTVAVLLGTVPGVFAGAVIRVRYLPDPQAARLFTGLVLLYLGGRLLLRAEPADVPSPGAAVETVSVSLSRVEYAFDGRLFAFPPPAVFLLALVVGVVGGIYGIGGGAILAPFLTGMLNLPIHTVAGATLSGTLVTSAAGVGSYELMAVRPDWTLAGLFGLGGVFGVYAGARMQRRLPERWIRLFLGAVAASLGVVYTAGSVSS
jgi:uncharacterized membrane protein YfcA